MTELIRATGSPPSTTRGHTDSEHTQVNGRNGVQEYLVLLPEEELCKWYCWQGDDVIEIETDDDGVMKSQIFPGLWFSPVHFWQGDVAGLLNCLQAGLDSDEHAAYIQK